jgi:hypothetical protein
MSAKVAGTVPASSDGSGWATNRALKIDQVVSIWFLSQVEVDRPALGAVAFP